MSTKTITQALFDASERLSAIADNFKLAFPDAIETNNLIDEWAEEVYNDYLRFKQPEDWRPLSEWSWGYSPTAVLGYSERFDEVAEYVHHDDGWTIASFNGQVYRDDPLWWKPLPPKPGECE